jgi:TolA-binding protein
MRLTLIAPVLLALGLWRAPSSARALEPLEAPAPLVDPRPAATPGESAITFASAQRAQALGFPSTAVSLFRTLLAAPGADSPRLTLALTTALLDEGDLAGAAAALGSLPAPRESAWHLRAGLVAAEQQRWDAARAELAGVRLPELAAPDAGWYYFLKGLLAEAGKDGAKDPLPGRAEGFYRQAAAAAVSELQRARFQLGQEQAALRVAAPTREQLEVDRQNAEIGGAVGLSFARAYAVALNAAGRKRAALQVLQSQLRRLAPAERDEADHARLLIGLIADPTDADGREALFQLLANGVDRDRQRAALELLVQRSGRGAERAEFRLKLDALIAAPRAHPILENLLLCRADLALTDRAYVRAEDDAHALLDKFPGSSLKSYALAVLASSAWEQRRYRTAADQAAKAMAAEPPGLLRAQLGVMVAEAWFRAGLASRSPDAGDFRNAADAYAVAGRDPPLGVAPGWLLFQRVEAEIQAAVQAVPRRSLDRAEAVLEEAARDPRFDRVDRWEAEWNLGKAREIAGETDAAGARLRRLLAEPGAGAVPGDLRARMVWLEARLAFDAGRPAETLRLVAALSPSALAELAPALRAELASAGALLRAQAEFALGREPAALDTLHRLSADFPRTQAATYAYVVEAGHYADGDQVARAQQLFIELADKFPASPYAPYALYQAALQAERLGQEKNLREADALIESLVTRYPDSDLVFYARLRQGDLLRKLNQFPQAETVYRSLINDLRFAQNPEVRPDILLAQLALAETLNALSANDPAPARQAADLFQDLLEREDATPDVRVEAGYNLGHLLARQGETDRAQAVWWKDVIDAFLLRPAGAAPGPGPLGAKGRWWAAQTLFESARRFEAAGRIEEARHAWQIVLSAGLPGAAAAREQLARFPLPGGKP